MDRTSITRLRKSLEARHRELRIGIAKNQKEMLTAQHDYGKDDGNDYPVTGDPNSDARSLKKIDAHTLELTVKKGGNITMTGRIVVSADGKSRTVTTSGTDATGKKITSTAVYDKQ
jgi:hypothetical protein